MSDIEVNSPIASSGTLDRATPPQTRLMIFIFSDEVKVDQAIDAVVTKLNTENHTFLYRLALAEKQTDGTVYVRDITEDWFGPMGTGAMIGGLSGLAGGPLGALIGVGAGALVGWSGELLNDEAVTKFAHARLRELDAGRHAIIAEVAEDSAASFEALVEENGGRICG